MQRQSTSILNPVASNRTEKADANLIVPDVTLGLGTRLSFTLDVYDAQGSFIETLVFDELVPFTIEIWDWLTYIAAKQNRLWPNVQTTNVERASKNYRLDFSPRGGAESLEIVDFTYAPVYNNYKTPGFYINGDSLTDAPPDGSTPIRSWAFLLRDDGRIHPNSVIAAQDGRALFNTGYPVGADPSEDVQYHILFLSSNDALSRAFGGPPTDSEHSTNVLVYMDEAINRGFTAIYKFLPPIQLNNTGEWPEQVLELRDVERDTLGASIPWNVGADDYIDSVHYSQAGHEDLANQVYEYMVSRVPDVPSPIVDVADREQAIWLIRSAYDLEEVA